MLSSLLITLTALAPLDASARAEPSCRIEQDTTRKVAIALLRASRRRDGPCHDEVVRRLVGLGSEAVELLLDLLVDRRIPALVTGDAPQTLSVPQRAMILDAFCRSSRSDVVNRIETRVAGSSDEAPRIAALYVYSALGGERSLPRLLELSLPAQGLAEEGLSPQLADALREAHAEILTREPKAHRSMPKLLERATPSQRRAMLFALGETADPCALPSFAEMLRRHPELSDLVISQALRVGASADSAVNESVGELVRPSLRSARASLVAASARLLGNIDHAPSAPDLVALLDHEELQVQESAHWALRRMSGLDLGPRSVAWNAWLASEQDWWNEEGPLRLEQLKLGSRATRLAAVDACGAHTLGRSRLAAAVTSALFDNDATVRGKACDALGQLGSPVASGGLLQALSDPTPAVSEAARRALQQIHGAPLPVSSEDCRAHLHL